jgi:hypothetical protein
MMDHGPAKRLIYEAEWKPDMDDMEMSLSYLEEALMKESEYQRWCPDWVYTYSPTEEEGVFDLKVYGEIEED